MNIIGHGIDLIECMRIEEVFTRHPEQFMSRILTPAERDYCTGKKNPIPHIAGRFAAKEAILKVIRTGWRGQIAWTDMEILNDSAGSPHVTLSGHTLEVARKLGITRVMLSITHTQNYAAASALGISE